MAVLEALQPMVNEGAGQTLVRDVRVDIQEDSNGEPALFIMLVLADPPAGGDSWPVDDLRALRNDVRERIATILEGERDLLPWYVMFEPEHATWMTTGSSSSRLRSCRSAAGSTPTR